MTFFDSSEIAEFEALRVEASADSAEIIRDMPPFVSDGHGGRVGNPQTIATVSAFVRQLGDRDTERVMGGFEQSTPLVLISVPSNTDVNVHDRVRINGTSTYEIVSVVPTRTFAVRKRLVTRNIS